MVSRTIRSSGFIRSLKADLRQRRGHPRITVMTTHINPDQIFDHPSPLSAEQQSLQKAVNRGLKPSNLDQDYYLVLGNFGPPYPNLKQHKSIYQFMIPVELSEPFTKKTGEESTTHLLYVDWRGQRLGLEHLRTELYPTRFTHPILRAELNVELPDLHQQLSNDLTPPLDYAKLMRLVHPWPDMPPRSS
jgi:hypothetical protein